MSEGDGGSAMTGQRVLFDSRGVRRALGLPDAGSPVRRYTSVSIDSRTVEPGALFVALRGQRHDGFEFLEEAAARGARGAVVPAGRRLPDLGLEWFPVEETLWALGDLAAWHRRRSGARVVGITGTSAKTTVKEMAALALAGSFRVHRTPGNLNSLVGLPLSVFAAPPGAELWVLELGSNHPGEIPRLARVADPDDAVVTTVGPAHLEAFGTEEAVLEEKLALVAAASPGGTVVVGERPPALVRGARELRPETLVAGLGEGADYRPDRWDVEPERVWFERGGVRYEVPAGGEHHLRDALLAAAVAEALGAEPEAVAAGLARFRPLGMRSALRRFGRLTVLADCYNANPESFEAAIAYLTGAFPGRRLAAVVGTMLELGERTEQAHREVAERLVEAGFSLVAATGAFEPAARALEEKRAAARSGSRRAEASEGSGSEGTEGAGAGGGEGADAGGGEGSGPGGAGGSGSGTRFLAAADPEEIWEPLRRELMGDEVVLVKASRGVGLEWVVERLAAAFGERTRRAAGAAGARTRKEAG